MSNKMLCNISDLSDYFVVPQTILQFDCSFSLKRLLCLIYDGCSHTSSICAKYTHLTSLYDSLGDNTVTFTEDLLAACCGVSIRQLKRLISNLSEYGIFYARNYSEYLGSFYYQFSMDFARFENCRKYKIPKSCISPDFDSSSLFVYTIMLNNLLYNNDKRVTPVALCSYSYISDALGNISSATICKAISNLVDSGLIKKHSCKKRKDSNYSFLVFLPEKNDLLDRLFIPFSVLERLEAEKTLETELFITELTNDKNEESGEISEISRVNTELSGDILEDNIITLKTFLSFRDNIKYISQLLHKSSSRAFISRLIRSKDLYGFRKRAIAYTMKTGLDYRTAARIVASFICNYISQAVESFYDMLNKKLITEDYKQYLNSSRMSRVKLDMYYRLYLVSSDYSSGSINSLLKLLINKVNLSTYSDIFTFMDCKSYDKSVDQIWYVSVMGI